MAGHELQLLQESAMSRCRKRSSEDSGGFVWASKPTPSASASDTFLSDLPAPRLLLCCQADEVRASYPQPPSCPIDSSCFPFNITIVRLSTQQVCDDSCPAGNFAETDPQEETEQGIWAWYRDEDTCVLRKGRIWGHDVSVLNHEFGILMPTAHAQPVCAQARN